MTDPQPETLTPERLEELRRILESLRRLTPSFKAPLVYLSSTDQWKLSDALPALLDAAERVAEYEAVWKNAEDRCPQCGTVNHLLLEERRKREEAEKLP